MSIPPTVSRNEVLLGPAPCDNCRYADRCRLERLPCDAFAVYLSGASENRWRNAPRLPSRERAAALLGVRLLAPEPA